MKVTGVHVVQWGGCAGRGNAERPLPGTQTPRQLPQREPTKRWVKSGLFDSDLSLFLFLAPEISCILFQFSRELKGSGSPLVSGDFQLLRSHSHHKRATGAHRDFRRVTRAEKERKKKRKRKNLLEDVVIVEVAHQKNRELCTVGWRNDQRTYTTRHHLHCDL